jgi:hypothetical protein
MNWVRAIPVVLVLWSNAASGATLTWNANSEPDVAGYRIYQCSLIPCGPGSGHESLLTNIGKVTSFNIGTPSVTRYYFITAYDSADNESRGSNLLTYTPPASSPPLPTPLKTINLTVVGNPTTGPWGVETTTTDLRDIMATVQLEQFEYYVDHNGPYNFPADNGLTVTTGRFGSGPHTIEFVFYLEGTKTEVGRANITVQEGASTSPSPPLKTIILAIVGDPTTGPWGVMASTSDLRDLMATVRLDGHDHHVEHSAPYSFVTDDGTTVTTGRFGSGLHRVEFVFHLEGTTTEVGRASIMVHEDGGSP